jgi:hypothetical protein
MPEDRQPTRLKPAGYENVISLPRRPSERGLIPAPLRTLLRPRQSRSRATRGAGGDETATGTEVTREG